jgi:hypothetical protein
LCGESRFVELLVEGLKRLSVEAASFARALFSALTLQHFNASTF